MKLVRIYNVFMHKYKEKQVDMFGIFKKKKDQDPPPTVYIVDFDKIETLEQLTEVVRCTFFTLSRHPIPRLRITEKGLENNPILRDVVVKEEKTK